MGDMYAEDVLPPAQPVPYSLTARGVAASRAPLPPIPPRPRAMRSAALLGCPTRRRSR